MSHSAVRSVLLAVLLVGAVGSVGMGTTYSLFTNAHDGTGTVSAADNINGGGNGNGNGVTADAGGPYEVTEDDNETLDASGSSAPTGNPNNYRYEWEVLTDISYDPLQSTSGPQVTFEAPENVSSDTTVEVQLTFTDNKGNTATDTTEVDILDSDN